MTTCGNEQTQVTLKGSKTLETTLKCVCDTDIVGTCHIHVTDRGVRFIADLDGVLVLGGGR
jgi:hypothetical protein